MPKRPSIKIPKKVEPESFSDVSNKLVEETSKADKIAPPPQKTIRFDSYEFMEAVKIVAKMEGMNEQDYILSVLRNDVNVKLQAAKEAMIAKMSSLPSQI